MRNRRVMSSKSRCYSHISSLIDAAIPKLITILPPNLKISLSIQFSKTRLHLIRGSEHRPTTTVINTTTTTTTKKKKKKKKQRSWIKPINRLARRISSMIYTSFRIRKAPSSHWDDVSDRDHDVDEEEEEEEESGETEKKDECLEYLMHKLSLALDGTTSSRYTPLMELLNQMRGGGDGDGDGGGGMLVRDRKVGMGRGFHVFSRKRRMRNRGRTIGKMKKMEMEEREEEEEEEWGNGKELYKRRILMGWRCRPIRDEEDDHDDY